MRTVNATYFTWADTKGEPVPQRKTMKIVSRRKRISNVGKKKYRYPKDLLAMLKKWGFFLLQESYFKSPLLMVPFVIF